MNERKFLNQAQPQTLVLATLLLYINAAFGLLFGIVATSLILGLATIVGLAIGGYGIANEWKWAYAVAVVAAILQLIMLVAVFGSDVINFPVIITLLFDGALVGLLLHPESRSSKRIWLKYPGERRAALLRLEPDERQVDRHDRGRDDGEEQSDEQRRHSVGRQLQLGNVGDAPASPFPAGHADETRDHDDAEKDAPHGWPFLADPVCRAH